MNNIKEVFAFAAMYAFLLFVFNLAFGSGQDVRRTVDGLDATLRASLDERLRFKVDGFTVFRAYDGVLHTCGHMTTHNQAGRTRAAQFVIAPGYSQPVIVTDDLTHDAFYACVGQIVFQRGIDKGNEDEHIQF